MAEATKPPAPPKCIWGPACVDGLWCATREHQSAGVIAVMWDGVRFEWREPLKQAWVFRAWALAERAAHAELRALLAPLLAAVAVQQRHLDRAHAVEERKLAALREGRDWEGRTLSHEQSDILDEATGADVAIVEAARTLAAAALKSRTATICCDGDAMNLHGLATKIEAVEPGTGSEAMR
jgi:hypothetical protein